MFLPLGLRFLILNKSNVLDTSQKMFTTRIWYGMHYDEQSMSFSYNFCLLRLIEKINCTCIDAMYFNKFILYLVTKLVVKKLSWPYLVVSINRVIVLSKALARIGCIIVFLVAQNLICIGKDIFVIYNNFTSDVVAWLFYLL